MTNSSSEGTSQKNETSEEIARQKLESWAKNPSSPDFKKDHADFLLAYVDSHKKKGFWDVVSSLSTPISLLITFVGIILTSYITLEYNNSQIEAKNLEQETNLTKLYFDNFNNESPQAYQNKQIFLKSLFVLSQLNFENAVCRLVKDNNKNLNLDDLSKEKSNIIEDENETYYKKISYFLFHANNKIILRRLSLTLFNDIFPNILNDLSKNNLTTVSSCIFKSRNNKIVSNVTDPSIYSIYIQYDKNNPVAKNKATQLQTEIKNIKNGFTAPEPEGVASVPQRNQIRIYKKDDTPKANDLKKILENNFPSPAILDISSSYPNLPANTMEIWIGSNP